MDVGENLFLLLFIFMPFGLKHLVDSKGIPFKYSLFIGILGGLALHGLIVFENYYLEKYSKYDPYSMTWVLIWVVISIVFVNFKCFRNWVFNKIHT